jgi:cation:H+ antiporter
VLGGVVGSDIYNVFGILRVTALVRPMEVPPAFAGADALALEGSAAALLMLAFALGGVGRIAGLLLPVAYDVYMGGLFTT